jgi:hypothetical protein
MPKQEQFDSWVETHAETVKEVNGKPVKAQHVITEYARTSEWRQKSVPLAEITEGLLNYYFAVGYVYTGKRPIRPETMEDALVDLRWWTTFNGTWASLCHDEDAKAAWAAYDPSEDERLKEDD